MVTSLLSHHMVVLFPRPPVLVVHDHSSFAHTDFPHCPVFSSLPRFLWTEAQSPVLGLAFRPWPLHSHHSILYPQHVLPETARLSSLPLISSCQQPVEFPDPLVVSLCLSSSCPWSKNCAQGWSHLFLELHQPLLVSLLQILILRVHVHCCQLQTFL